MLKCVMEKVTKSIQNILISGYKQHGQMLGILRHSLLPSSFSLDRQLLQDLLHGNPDHLPKLQWLHPCRALLDCNSLHWIQEVGNLLLKVHNQHVFD